MDITALSNRLKELRLANQLSQGQIAKYLHLTTQAYCNYENAKRIPDIDLLLKLAELYHMTLEELLDGTVSIPELPINTLRLAEAPAPQVKSVIKPSLKPLSPRQQQLIALFEQLPPKEQEDFLDLISLMYRKKLR